MRIFLILLLIVNLILFLPIFFKCKINFDFCNNKGVLSIFFFSFNIALFKFSFLINKIYIKEKKKRISFIYYSDLTNQNKLREIFFILLLNNVDIKNLRFISKVGVKENAYISSLLCAGLNIVSSIFFNFLIEKKNIDKIMFAIFPNYYKSDFLLCFTTSVSINIFMIIYCFVLSLSIKLRKEKIQYGNNK